MLVLVVSIVSVLGCRKAGIVISSGATVASAVGGAALVGRSEQGTTAHGAGTLLIAYAIVGLTVTAGFVASVLEDRDSSSTEDAYHHGGSHDPDSFYDRTGAGGHDPDGNFYDRTGAPDGRVDSSGNFYDRTGAPAGRLDNSGNVYDRTGAPSGRIDPSGSYYDRTGAPAGRIDDSGNIYDRTGAPAGRVDSSCDAACRRAAVSRILLDNK